MTVSGDPNNPQGTLESILQDIQRNIQEINQRLDRQDERFARQDERFTRQDERFETFDARIEKTIERGDRFSERLQSLAIAVILAAAAAVIFRPLIEYLLAQQLGL